MDNKLICYGCSVLVVTDDMVMYRFGVAGLCRKCLSRGVKPNWKEIDKLKKPCGSVDK